MGIDKDFATAFAKSQIGARMPPPMGGKLFVSVKDSDKPVIVPAVKQAIELAGDRDRGTARYLQDNAVAVTEVNKVAQGRPHIVDRIKDGQIALIFNTTEGWQSLKDSQSIRASALTGKVPYFTTAAGSDAATHAIGALRAHSLEVKPLQDYY